MKLIVMCATGTYS